MERHEPERWNHCWEPGPEAEDGMCTVCVLRLDHDGPHEWTRGDRVRVSFDAERNMTAEIEKPN